MLKSLVVRYLYITLSGNQKRNTMKANDILMTALEIVKLMEARERQLWEEYVEARDANGNLHAVTKRHYAVWEEMNETLDQIRYTK